jgi:uncharacterized membrane protein
VGVGIEVDIYLQGERYRKAIGGKREADASRAREVEHDRSARGAARHLLHHFGERLLAVAPAPIDLAILIAAKAGLRHQETRFLQVRDADLARSILLVRAKHGSIWSEEPKRFTKAIFSDSGGPKIARQVIAC